MAELQGQFTGHMHFGIAHPEALRRLYRLDREIVTAAWEMDLERQDLDGIPARAPEPTQAARGLFRGLHRDGPEMDHGIELGL